MRIFTALLTGAMLAPVVALAEPPAGRAWIHGSFVNLRQAAKADAGVVAQLPANTTVELLARSGDWCEIAAPAVLGTPARRGFVGCALIGDQPLTLAALGATGHDAARRAFWVAPGWQRFIALGDALAAGLRPEAQTKKALQQRRALHWPVPEFEAAKARLRQGVRPRPDLEFEFEIAPLGKEYLADLPAGALPKAQPSLFARRSDFALKPDVDRLAALGRSELKLIKVLRGPEYKDNRLEEEWFDGVWDVGMAEIAFEPAAIGYAIAANGLLSAQAIASVVAQPHAGEHDFCTSEDANTHPRDWMEENTRRLRGYAQFAQDQRLISFYTALTLKPEGVRVRKREVKTNGRLPAIPNIPTGRPDEGKVALYEIDLNGDQKADLVIIQGQTRGEIAEWLRTTRVLVNIGGVWSLELSASDVDCT